MIIKHLIFDDHNRRHIARHGVEEIDVRSACSNRHVTRQARNGYLLLIGQILPVGRILTVVLQPMPGSAYRVVTAHFANEQERRLFIKEVEQQ